MNEKFLEKTKRIDDMVACRESDRIGIAPSLGFLPIRLYGETTIEAALKDWNNAYPSFKRYHLEYDPDLLWGPSAIMWPTNVLETMDCNYVRWPGKHISDPMSGFQVIAEDYMEQDEYLEYAEDPTGFMIRKVLPRHFKNLEGLGMTNLNSPVYFGSVYGMIPFGLPPVQNALKTMMTAGEQMLGVVGGNGAFTAEMAELGFPNAADTFGTIPFDVFNDTLRGLMNATMDMYDCPDELEEACKAATKVQVRNIKNSFATMDVKHVAFYVHNGTDEFMSPENFERFYWPGMKAVIEAVIECGGIPRIYTEGNYAQKLDYFKELPAGKCILNIIGTDNKLTKEKLGGHMCIAGGVDGTIVEFGTPEEVERNVKETLDIMAPGGGYILDCSVSLEKAPAENLRALFDTAREYGKY